MAVVSTGTSYTPKPPPSTPTDVVYALVNNYAGSGFSGGPISGTEFSATSGFIGGVVSGYALSGGSTHVGGFWPMQAGSTAITTDGTGQAAITFPYAFANTPTAVTATVNGSDYFARIVSKATTSFTVKILNQNPTPRGSIAVGVGLSTLTANGSLVATDAALYAASSSGGVTGSSFVAPLTIAGPENFIYSVSLTSGSAVASGDLPNTFAPLTNTNVQIDWMAAA